MFKRKDKKSKSVFDEMDKETLATDSNDDSNEVKVVSYDKTHQKESADSDNETNSSSTNPNLTFFEKFEKSKKDIIKDKKRQKSEAKKSIGSRNKGLGFENRLRDDIFIRNLWIIVGVVSVLLLAYASVVVGFLGDKFNGTSSSDYKWTYVNYFSDMNKAIVVFCGIIIVLIPLPYLYLLVAWFIGINSVHRSKIYVIVLLTFLSISLLLTIIVIPMSSVIFANVNGFRPLAS